VLFNVKDNDAFADHSRDGADEVTDCHCQDGAKQDLRRWIVVRKSCNDGNGKSSQPKASGDHFAGCHVHAVAPRARNQAKITARRRKLGSM